MQCCVEKMAVSFILNRRRSGIETFSACWRTFDRPLDFLRRSTKLNKKKKWELNLLKVTSSKPTGNERFKHNTNTIETSLGYLVCFVVVEVLVICVWIVAFNGVACVAWRFCQEHDWAAKPQKRAQSARERAAKPREKLLLPQSPRGFSALPRLYYLARPTITAMLRRLAVTRISGAVLGHFCVELIT